MAMTTHDDNHRWMIPVALALVLRLVLMLMFPMLDTSEPRYAEIARIMAESGDWITPWFEPGIPFWGKPPLAFWMSALSFKVLGYSDFAARLPSFLASLATLWLIHHYTKARFSQAVARFAVIVYITCALPFLAAGAMLTDAFLTLSMTLSLVAFGLHRNDRGAHWGYLFFLGLAMGMLSKGPLAPVLTLAVIACWMVASRQPPATLRGLPWATGILSFMALTAPWYVLAELKTPGFLNYFIVGEHISRFLDPGWQGDLYGSAHKRVYGSIWLDWFLATFPWGVMAVWGLARSVIRHKTRQAIALDNVSSTTIFLVIWALICPLFFTLSGNILWTYVQPSLPAFAILFAAGTLHGQASQTRKPKGQTLFLVIPITALLLGALALAYPERLRTEKHLIQYHAEHAQSDQPLCYLNSRPFSARYYSKGNMPLCNGPDLQKLLDAHPSGIYLAVRTEHLESLRDLVVSPVLFKNRNTSLVFVRRPTALESKSLDG